MIRVRVIGKDRSCCGVLKQGWEGSVAYAIPLEDLGIEDSILVLDDNTLVWESQTEEIESVDH